MSGWAEREKVRTKALERAAKKMMAVALTIENLGPEFEDPAIRLRAEAALAFQALHQDED